MRALNSRKTLLAIAVVLLLVGGLVGCASMDPPELTQADQVLAAARQAGKDRQCPDEFAAAERANADAHALCKTCYWGEAVAKSKQALDMANALCKTVVKVAPPPPPAAPAPPPPPPPPAAPAPTVSASTNPSTVMAGKCSTLTWSSTNASSVSIEPGIGRVGPSGSREVCPDRSTTYTVTASGDGGTRDTSAGVTVNRVVDKMTVHINFDTAKSTIKKSEEKELQQALDFIKKYPNAKIHLAGYTDSVGKPDYNQGLSERRAASVKEYLVAHGIDSARIETTGHGENDPIADNKTAKGRAENRRTEVLIISE